jgi:hypothetical protein
MRAVTGRPCCAAGLDGRRHQNRRRRKLASRDRIPATLRLYTIRWEWASESVAAAPGPCYNRTVMTTQPYAPRIGAAYRGIDFEEELKTTHEDYQRRGLAIVSKHEVRKVRRRDGSVIYAAKSVSDFTGVLAGGRFVAFDAKSLRRPASTWKPDARQLHQLDYLRQVAALGGIAFYLVRNGLDEARIVTPGTVAEGQKVDLNNCPLLQRSFSSAPWDWLPLVLAAGL